jgi:hypothetical protein
MWCEFVDKEGLGRSQLVADTAADIIKEKR